MTSKTSLEHHSKKYLLIVTRYIGKLVILIVQETTMQIVTSTNFD